MLQEKRTSTILFVDDEKSILNTLQHIFTPQNYTVYIASSAKEGLALLSENSIDVVVSDMRMPEMDGALFLKTVAEKWPNTKRILLTGFTDMQAAISAVNEGGIDYYLTKPWKNDYISKVIASLMESKLLTDNNRELQDALVKKNAELTQFNQKLEEKVEERTRELKETHEYLQKSYDSTTQVLLSIVELYEGIRGHNIAEDAKKIAEILDLPHKQQQDIYLAAMLHNIGKVGLAKEIISKPLLALNKNEIKEFTQYPILGSATLIPFSPLKEVANIILHHRENFSGNGFPHKILAEDIPLGARILNIVVNYYELQEGLICHKKLSASQAVAYIKEHFSDYDPKILSIFLETLAKSVPESMQATATTHTDEYQLMPHQLESGMMLSRNLTTTNGFVLVQEGQIFTPELVDQIKKIKFKDGFTVYVRQ